MNADAILLFGAGLPILLVVLLVAERQGAFAGDAFPSRPRRWMALALLYGILVLTAVAPGARRIDPRSLTFPSLFLGHAALLLFLGLWWALAGRPPVLDFLALRTPTPLRHAALGLALGLFGCALTLRISLDIGVTLWLLKVAPRGISPLVKWMFSLTSVQRLLIVLVSMTVEELFFRSFLQRRFGPIGASLLFLASHAGYGDPLVFLGLTGITAALALGLYLTKTVVPSIFAHGLFNAAQLFLTRRLLQG